MPKLKKARQSAAPPTTPARASSSAAPHPSSSRRPPSLLSASSRASPLALRSASSLAPAVSASTVEAHGELIEANGSDGGNAATGARGQRSRSPTASTAISPGPTASEPPTSPGRSPASRRSRLPSNVSATDSLGTPSTPPDWPAHDRFSSASSSSSHALATLRTRLDSDQAARDTYRVQEEHARAGSAGGKLRKKLPHEVAAERAVLHDGHAGADGVDTGPPDEGVADAGDQAWVAGAVASPPPPPSKEEEGPLCRSASRDGDAPNGLGDGKEASPAAAHGSLLLAPARLGWRAASSAAALGIGTGRAVLSHVPLVSSAGRIVAGVVDVLEEDVKHASARLGGYATALSGSAGALGAADAADQVLWSSAHADGEPNADQTGKPKAAPPTALVRHADIPLSPAGIAYRAVELSLGISLASVLVVGALTSMAWDSVRGRG
ncbi:hypothetical protein JCM3770_005280 [Rhodotorula araucariae]